jgi:hypothetical protein
MMYVFSIRAKCEINLESLYSFFKAWSNYSTTIFNKYIAPCLASSSIFFLLHSATRRFLHFNYVILFNNLFTSQFTYVQMRLLVIIRPQLSFNLKTGSPNNNAKVHSNLQQFCIQCVSQAELKPFLYDISDYSICCFGVA